MKIITPQITAAVPTLYTLEGRQYEIKTISKRSKFIAGITPIPAAAFVPSVVFGNPNGLIVPINENDVNIFLDTPNPIIPLSFIYVETDSFGLNPFFFDSKNYTYINSLPIIESDLVKTTKAQSLIQYLQLKGSNNNLSLNNIKLTKNDFIFLEYPNRIFWTYSNINSLNIPLTGINLGAWNEHGPFVVISDYYVTMIFTYLELI